MFHPKLPPAGSGSFGIIPVIRRITQPKDQITVYPED
jgi:hypothetical protein